LTGLNAPLAAKSSCGLKSFARTVGIVLLLPHRGHKYLLLFQAAIAVRPNYPFLDSLSLNLPAIN